MKNNEEFDIKTETKQCISCVIHQIYRHQFVINPKLITLHKVLCCIMSVVPG